MTDKTDDDKVRKRIELFERYLNDPDQHHKLFSELGFSYMVDECEGNCTHCKDNTTCEIFAKIKGNEEFIS